MTGYDAGRSSFRALAVLSLIAGLLALALWLYLLGSVVVRDPDSVIAAVLLSNSETEQVARSLPGRLHLSTASLEGEALIRCRSGVEISLGYITSATHLRKTVRAADCAARPS